MNCKPNDIAVICGGTVNDGHIVEVLRQDPDGAMWDGEFRWIVHCPTPLLGTADDGSGEDRLNTEGSIPDANLRPIAGIPVAQDLTVKLGVPHD